MKIKWVQTKSATDQPPDDGPTTVRTPTTTEASPKRRKHRCMATWKCCDFVLQTIVGVGVAVLVVGTMMVYRHSKDADYSDCGYVKAKCRAVDIRRYEDQSCNVCEGGLRADQKHGWWDWASGENRYGWDEDGTYNKEPVRNRSDKEEMMRDGAAGERGSFPCYEVIVEVERNSRLDTTTLQETNHHHHHRPSRQVNNESSERSSESRQTESQSSDRSSESEPIGVTGDDRDGHHHGSRHPDDQGRETDGNNNERRPGPRGSQHREGHTGGPHPDNRRDEQDENEQDPDENEQDPDENEQDPDENEQGKGEGNEKMFPGEFSHEGDMMPPKPMNADSVSVATIYDSRYTMHVYPQCSQSLCTSSRRRNKLVIDEEVRRYKQMMKTDKTFRCLYHPDTPNKVLSTAMDADNRHAHGIAFALVFVVVMALILLVYRRLRKRKPRTDEVSRAPTPAATVVEVVKVIEDPKK